MRFSIAAVVVFGIALSSGLAAAQDTTPGADSAIHCSVTAVYNHGFRCKAEDKSWDFHTAKEHLDNVTVGERVRVVSHSNRGAQEADSVEADK